MVGLVGQSVTEVSWKQEGLRLEALLSDEAGGVRLFLSSPVSSRIHPSPAHQKTISKTSVFGRYRMIYVFWKRCCAEGRREHKAIVFAYSNSLPSSGAWGYVTRKYSKQLATVLHLISGFGN